MIGSEKTNVAATRDRKSVSVTLSKGFWMGEHEVTQREYSLVMRKNIPTGFTTHKNAPFWGITESKNITDYCRKLSNLERKAGTLTSGWEYRCPSEAEWEYTCRAGSSSAYCYGDSPAELGRYGTLLTTRSDLLNPIGYASSAECVDEVRLGEFCKVVV